jgi:uncharacterized protein YceK
MYAISRKIILLLAVLAMLAGCSFSYSSKSSSNSSKSSSTSSGGSETSPEDAKKNYMGDVSSYTSSAVKGSDAKEYFNELGKIAERNGITDWERNIDTYHAVGNGLRRAGVNRDEVKDIYFIPEMVAKEKNALILILESYQP